jgi:exodeoxyribonuclease-3
MLKIATWNVNSIRVRLEHVLSWLKNEKPDLLALQETKILDDDFPVEEFTKLGFSVTYSGQKTYNGVAFITRQPVSDPFTDLPHFIDPARRILGVTYQGIRFYNLYVPNGERVDSEKYHYKLHWLQNIKVHLQSELKQYANCILLGDFNIAPDHRDVHDPAMWEGRILCSDNERQLLSDILQSGFVDCFRLHSDEKVFSWWDYRLNSFKRNLGLRIDHIFASEALRQKCTQCFIDKTPRGLERPSDHAPVVAEFDILVA